MRAAAALLALALGSSACSLLLGLDEAEFDPSLEGDGGGGDDGGAADASGGTAGTADDVVAGSAGAGGASDE